MSGQQPVKMRAISSDDIRSILTYPQCIKLMREAMESVAKDKAILPLRQAMPIAQSRNMLGMMPGYVGGEAESFGVKLLSLYPENPKQGFPSHMGLYTLFDAEFGQPVAVMDANALTAIRTASATAAATDILARKNATSLLIVGTGEQAATHILALNEIRDFEEIRIWGRDVREAERLARELGGDVNAKLRAYSDLAKAAKDMDIITLVTASPTPLIDEKYLRNGTHINTVGSSHRAVMEIAPEMLVGSRFFVDYRASAMDQAGELLAAIKHGLVEGDGIIAEIGDVFIGKAAGRLSDQDITIYKSLGIAAQDILAAKFVLKQSELKNMGTEFTL